MCSEMVAAHRPLPSTPHMSFLSSAVLFNNIKHLDYTEFALLLVKLKYHKKSACLLALSCPAWNGGIVALRWCKSLSVANMNATRKGKSYLEDLALTSGYTGVSDTFAVPRGKSHRVIRRRGTTRDGLNIWSTTTSFMQPVRSAETHIHL